MFAPSRFTRRVIPVVLVLASTAWVCADELSDDGVRFFEKHVRPLLVERCLECHSADSEPIGGNLLLDRRAGWVQGGDLGATIVPGDAERSLLITAVRHARDDLQMPPDGKLSDAEIRVLEQWIRMGAPDPRADSSPKASAEGESTDPDFWAFQSPHTAVVPLPLVQNREWPRSEVDLFILAELERRGLRPARRADPRTLIRRVTFDLTGLPPTPDEVRRFLADDSPEAFARLVDRLLASPRYGERWGRFWLDVARYADSNGLDENIAHGNAWRYRDYVIRSLNHDKPFDQFVREQLAGDLLPGPATEEVRRDRTIATGFLSLGPKVLAEVDETKMEMDIIDEQVDTVGRAFMALTLGCARCHDHKFDPISTDDYYALAGIFKSTKTMEHFTKIARWNEVEIESPAERRRRQNHDARVKAKKQEVERFVEAAKAALGGRDAAITDLNDVQREQLNRLEEELKQLEASCPVPASAMSVVDYPQPTDLRVHVRGSHLTQTHEVKRGFPQVFAADTATVPSIAGQQSGRRELADWLVDGRHPLVARVIVNRIWRWHFGRGLVESTDNLGRLGARPTNQPLLDWLARLVVRDAWSLKSVHRQIMLSATYQASSEFDASNAAIDPENRYQWRADVRRLEAETIRDAILAVSGRLDTSTGGSLLHVENREFLFDHTSLDRTRYDSPRRSVYLPVIRNNLYDGFQLFDYTNASVMNSNRASTVVAPQALFLMNSDLVVEAARAFAERLDGSPQLDQSQRIDLAYQLALGRSPTESERSVAREFLQGFSQQGGEFQPADTADSGAGWVVFCQALLMCNEAIHVR